MKPSEKAAAAKGAAKTAVPSPQSSFSPNTELAIGLLQAPYGLKGELKLRSYSGELSHFEALVGKAVTIKKDGTLRQWILESARLVQPHYLAKFKGLDVPETARKLTGGEILVPRDQAASLDENEYYVTDLVGCSIVLSAQAEAVIVTETVAASSGAGEKEEPAATTYSPGSVLGQIVEVWDNTADDLLAVKLTMGKIVQIPFRTPFIGKVDLEARSVELLTSWLLD